MAKLGSKKYKGPVHEAIRKTPLGALAKSKRKSKSRGMTESEHRAAAARSRAATKRQYGKEHAKARKLMATNTRRRTGTYSAYDPLSSISAPKPKAKSVGNKTASARTGRPVKSKTGSTSRTKKVAKVAAKRGVSRAKARKIVKRKMKKG